MNKKSAYLLIAVIITILAGLVIIKTSTINGNMDNSTSSGLRIEENAIYATDQKPGNTLTVSIAVLKEPGFVVIHKDNNENPGDIVGVSNYLSSGEHINFEIKLTAPVKDGQKLYAMIHKDDGDKTYSTADSLVQSKLGGPIMMMFYIDKNVFDQPAVSL